MDKKKYNIPKWRKIIATTLSNYANMIKRLERRKNISEIILIYYSIFLIIGTLTCKYFPDYYDSTANEYFSIVLSIVVLVYSLINKNANYATRIASVQDSLNGLKAIKRELDEENFDKLVAKYNEITDKTERRSDVDFFITVKQLCKEYNINWITKKRKQTKLEEIKENSDDEQAKAVNNYISEINVLLAESSILCEYIKNFILILIPVIIFIVCIVVKIYM